VPLVVAIVLFLATLCANRAAADVGVILDESLDTSVARITGSGHSAVYLSRICPESPIRLRLCRAGEMGSVISNYTSLGEDQPFEWNVMPLSVYLYGVEDPAERPIFGLPKIKHALEERYREQYLAEYCTSESCKTSDKAEWRETIGATLSRSVYIFVVNTSVEQDLAFIKEFNSRPNVNHFNGFSRNCATFTRGVVDSFFHGAAHADYFNDFLMTSPKAIARSFTHYALHHPELNLRVFHFAQLPGTIRRSTEARAGTEQLFRSKKLVAPVARFVPWLPTAAAGSYLLTDRFNPEHEAEKHPALLQAVGDPAIGAEKLRAYGNQANDPGTQLRDTRLQIDGTAEEWKQSHEDFDGLMEKAIREGTVTGREYFDHFAKDIDEKGTLSFDSHGALWLEITEGGRTRQVGASADDIVDPSSDSELAYTLLLTRTDRELKSPKHLRETMAEFRDDWQTVEAARARTLVTFATADKSEPQRAPMPLRARP